MSANKIEPKKCKELKEKKIGVCYLSTKHTLKMRKVVHHSSSLVIKGEDQGAE